MLALTRKRGQSIVIGDDITITVVHTDDAHARLAIDAPRHIPIRRTEIIDTDRREAP